MNSSLYRIFVDINNTVFVTDTDNNNIYVWFAGSVLPDRVISGGMNTPYAIFVSLNGDIYVDNGFPYGTVEKRSSNGTSRTIVMYVSGSCLGLFVDIYGNIFCSLDSSHRVIRRSSSDSINTTTIVAGNGTSGNASNMLSYPRGIFVDTTLKLYVADYSNHRIQLFLSGHLNGTTVAGNGATGTIVLTHPTGVVLDADRNLFITDSDNKRIVGSGPNGFRCIVGCWDSTGNGINPLNGPRGLGFDSYGNLFVVDGTNSSVQKFFLATNSCGEYCSKRTYFDVSLIF